MFRQVSHPILAPERPLTAVQRLADYYQRSALLRARALIDPDHDPRTRRDHEHSTQNA